jgi:hypothetical protein
MAKCHVFCGLVALREVIRSFHEVWKDFPRDFLASYDRSVMRRRERFMAKQTKITIETDSLLIIRGRTSTRAWCSQCAAEVEVIALEETGVVSNLERPALEEWLNSVELHRSLAADGSTLICLNSLLARVQNTKTR